MDIPSSPGLPYVCHYPKSMRTASGLEIEIEKIYTLTRIHKEIHMYLENLFIYTFEIANTWWFKVTFLGWLSDPFKGLSDLQLGDEKGTLNHLVHNTF